MAKHRENTKHEICVSFSDLSTWCYNCDSYIDHGWLKGILWNIEQEKFPSSQQGE